MLRVLHFRHILQPIHYLVGFVKRESKVHERNRSINLITTLFGTMLVSHEFACIWIYLGTLHDDSWINLLRADIRHTPIAK